MAQTVKVLMRAFVTHDVNRYIVEKPDGYAFKPGQATDVALDQKGWREQTHPFTFTSLNEDEVLEFTIKSYPITKYPKHEGLTERLAEYSPGDRLLIGDPWGTIAYKGPGLFLAAGAGITPFIAILRDLRNRHELDGNKLIFTNKERQDVILEKEWRDMFGSEELMLTLTREAVPGYETGRIDAKKIGQMTKDMNRHFYVCGPKMFVAEMKDALQQLGATSDTLVFEE
jgi:ferredoxin-NADP reductase